MNDDTKAILSEIMGFTAETWKGVAIAAGLTAGFFETLKTDSPITIGDIAKRKGYDVDKVRKWIRFAEGLGIVEMNGEAATLTTKGSFYSSNSPYKEVLAFIEETAYFIKAAAASETTFKNNQSFDKLSDGKISKDYQPKVSDNLSIVLIDHIKAEGMIDEDKLLDIGCGSGSFLRALQKAMPAVRFSGIDANLFAIEKGKKENIALGLADRITMLVGDMLEDMADFPDNSYEWVTAINVLHFVQEAKREALIQNLVRISRKGAFFNTVEIGESMITAAGNPLLHLLWNDYAGFYTKEGASIFFAELPGKYKNCNVKIESIIQGNSKLVTILKK